MPPKLPVLIMIQGEQPGARYVLAKDRPTNIGRSSQNTISLVGPAVSRNHCRVTYDYGVWRVNDLGSKCGTFVNGERLESELTLKPGDVIRISTNAFRFDLIDQNILDDEGMLAVTEAQLGGQVRAGEVAVGDLEGYVHFFSNLDGEPVARVRLGSKAITVNPLVVADRLYVQSDSGSIAAYVVVDPERPQNVPDIAAEEGA